jgi:DNA repair photolyase
MAKLEKVASGVIPSTDNEFLSFYKVVGGNEGSKCHYPARLDTYGRGCGHDCSYCYAKSTLYFHGQWNPERPDVADIRRIENRIRKLEKGTIVRLGGMTDCFQPCELEYRVTLKTIKLLNKYGIGYLIVTKSHHVADDEYLAVMDPKLAHIQITVTTTDDARSLTYEKASVPSKRIGAIEKLYAAGFDVAFRLSPFIEGYIDFDILNNIKCDKILVEFLRTNQFIKKWFDVDYSQYTLWQDGFNHLPLEKKLEMLKNITGFKEVTVCEDYSEHYNYWKEHFNPNPDDCCNLSIFTPKEDA